MHDLDRLVDAANGIGGFAAHMVRHEVIMIVAALLLVPVRPLGPCVRAFRHLTRPLDAWLLYFAALWMRHVLVVFRSALASNGLHALQHACLLFSVQLFW